jgi:hypothetical protein
MQRILQQHVGRGELVHDIEVAGLAPEVGEPSPDDSLVGLGLVVLGLVVLGLVVLGLVVFLFAHRILSFVSRGVADRGR